MMTHQVIARLRGLVCRESPTPSTTKLLHHRAIVSQSRCCSQAAVPQDCKTKNCYAPRCATKLSYHQVADPQSRAPDSRCCHKLLYQEGAPQRTAALQSRCTTKPLHYRAAVPQSRFTTKPLYHETATEPLYHKAAVAPKLLYHEAAPQRTAVPRAAKCRTKKPLYYKAAVPRSRRTTKP